LNGLGTVSQFHRQKRSKKKYGFGELAGQQVSKSASQQVSEFAAGGVAGGAHGFSGCDEFRPFAFYLRVCANGGIYSANPCGGADCLRLGKREEPMSVQ
jgi:hypothetical protein